VALGPALTSLPVGPGGVYRDISLEGQQSARWGEMTRIKREYGAGRVDKSGKILISETVSESEKAEAPWWC